MKKKKIKECIFAFIHFDWNGAIRNFGNENRADRILPGKSCLKTPAIPQRPSRRNTHRSGAVQVKSKLIDQPKIGMDSYSSDGDGPTGNSEGHAESFGGCLVQEAEAQRSGHHLSRNFSHRRLRRLQVGHSFCFL